MNIIVTYKTPDQVKKILDKAKKNNFNIYVAIFPKTGTDRDNLTSDYVVEAFPSLFNDDMTIKEDVNPISLYKSLPTHKKLLGDYPTSVSPSFMNDHFRFDILDRNDLNLYIYSMKQEVDNLLGKINNINNSNIFYQL